MIDEEFPFYKKVWLITEMARTDNIYAVKDKYRRVFRETSSEESIESIIGQISRQYKSDINILRKFAREDLESHEMSSPRVRLDNYKRIAKMAEEGVPSGADALGNPIYKVDLKAAIDANKQAREETNMVIQNELRLLQIVVQSERLKQVQMTSGNTDLAGSGNHLEVTEVVDPKRITTDNHQYFDDDDE
jgi:hypothetical protein